MSFILVTIIIIIIIILLLLLVNIIIHDVVHTSRSFDFCSSNYKRWSQRPCLWNAAGAALSPVRRRILMLRTAVPVALTITRSCQAYEQDFLRCATVAWGQMLPTMRITSGFSRSTLNMAAVGSFETSSALPHRHSISKDFKLVPNFTHLDGQGFLSLHSRCAFHLQASAAWQNGAQGSLPPSVRPRHGHTGCSRTVALPVGWSVQQAAY